MLYSALLIKKLLQIADNNLIYNINIALSVNKAKAKIQICFCFEIKLKQNSALKWYIITLNLFRDAKRANYVCLGLLRL